jgi:hypothetical protein
MGLAAEIRPAERFGCGDLFGRAHVGLGYSDFLTGAGNLAFVPFGKSFIHTAHHPFSTRRGAG